MYSTYIYVVSAVYNEPVKYESVYLEILQLINKTIINNMLNRIHFACVRYNKHRMYSTCICTVYKG